jgi:hypothetical protein
MGGSVPGGTRYGVETGIGNTIASWSIGGTPLSVDFEYHISTGTIISVRNSLFSF